MATMPEVDADQAAIDGLAEAAGSVAVEALAPLVDRVLAWIDELIEADGEMADVPAMLAERMETLSEAEISDLAAVTEKQLLASGLRGREAAKRRMSR